MNDVADYLMINYYSQYHGTDPDVIPSLENMRQGLKNQPDKIVVVRDKTGIKGVAIYLTLSDKSYDLLETMNITKKDVLMTLLEDHGPNVHFILLCAKGVNTILLGMKEVLIRERAKTVSWWSPDLNRLHKYIVKEGAVLCRK
jgi:hypothetical protein